MARFSTDLDWKIDAAGYDLFDNGKGRWSIIRNGGELLPTRPFDRIDNHFKLFAAVKTKEDLLKFVKIFGMLDDPDPLGSSVMRVTENGRLEMLEPPVELEGELVDTHLDQAKLFRAVLLAKQSGRNVPKSIGLAIADKVEISAVGEIFLAPDVRRGVKFSFAATSLMNGMWIQLAQAFLAGITIRSCNFCGAFFETGVGTDRRADAFFCSKVHQIEFNSRKRSKRPQARLPPS